MGFQEAVRESREHCKTRVTYRVRKEGCEARVDGVHDDDEHEGFHDREGGKRGLSQPREQERIEHEMTHLLFRRLMLTLHQVQRTRGGMSTVSGQVMW